MKRLSLICTLCLLWSTVFLNASEVTLGYCSDVILSRGQGIGSATNLISAAIQLPTEQYRDYQGCQIRNVRFVLSQTEHLTSFKVWVRAHLADTLNLSQLDVPLDSLKKGDWTHVELPTPVDITAHDTLYVGYSYTQTERAYVQNYAGAKHTGGYFAGIDGRWIDYSAKVGPLSIRVSLEPTQAESFRLLDAQLTPRFAAQGTPMRVTGSMQYLGKDPISAYRIQVTDGENAGLAQTLEYQVPECTFADTLYYTFEWVPQTADCPNAPLAVQLSSSHSAPVAHTLYYERYTDALWQRPQVLLVENYTSLQNGYCPLANQRLETAIAAYRSQRAHDTSLPALAVLTRHEGYGPADSLRVTAGTDYQPLVFGSQNLAFAPAVTFQRYRAATCTHNYQGDGVALSTLQDPDTLLHVLMTTAAEAKEFAQMHYRTTIDTLSSELCVDVNIQLRSTAFCSRPRLVVALVFDNVAYRTPAKNYYPDQVMADAEAHTVCAYLTPKGGSPLWSDLDPTGNEKSADAGMLTKRYTYQLPEGQQAAHLHAVVYLCNADGPEIYAVGQQIEE